MRVLTHNQVPFYSLTLNFSVILTYSNFGKVYGNSSNDVYESLFRICSGSLVLAAAGFLPGFIASFFLIDSWGRKPIQLMGFIALTTLFLIMGMLSSCTSPVDVFTPLRSLCLCSIELHELRPARFHLPILPRQLFPEFWSEHDHVYRSWRSLSYSLSFHSLRYFRSVWQNGRGHRTACAWPPVVEFRQRYADCVRLIRCCLVPRLLRCRAPNTAWKCFPLSCSRASCRRCSSQRRSSNRLKISPMSARSRISLVRSKGEFHHITDKKYRCLCVPQWFKSSTFVTYSHK